MRKIVGLAAVVVLTTLATANAQQLELCVATCSNGGPGYQGGAYSYWECCSYFYEFCGGWGTGVWAPIDGPHLQCPQA